MLALSRRFPLFRLSFRSLNTQANFEELSLKYRSLGGCTKCLEENKYECTHRKDCPQSEKEDEFFLQLRTSILDVKYIRDSTEKKRKILEYPEQSTPSSSLKFDNWTSYLKSRGVSKALEPQQLRFLSKALTYPLTVSQFLIQNPPYNFTDLGKKTIEELRTFMHSDPRLFFRICLLGPRAECAVPDKVWRELSVLFPKVNFSLLFIGPEVPPNLDKQTSWASKKISMSYYRLPYHEIHDNLVQDDYIADFYVGLNSGVGFEGYLGSWDQSIEKILSVKKPFLFSSHNVEDLERDYTYMKHHEKNFDWLLYPSANRFSSLFYDILSTDIKNVITPNHSVFMIQGK